MDVISDDADLSEQVEKRQLLRKLCAVLDDTLDEQERQVILLRYGLGGNAPLKQRQVAQITGISRSYVSRIEKKALEKLRKALE